MKTFKPANLKTFFNVLKALEEKDIKVLDWDSKTIEVEFPNGERARWDAFWAASHLANELNK